MTEKRPTKGMISLPVAPISIHSDIISESEWGKMAQKFEEDHRIENIQNLEPESPPSKPKRKRKKKVVKKI
jgi:hypothetical protein